MQGLKVILARSLDGYLAASAGDDMRWTGPLDKRLFKMLTHVGGVIGVGSNTARLMPYIPGRTLVPLSRSNPSLMTLGEFARREPNAWLAGGPSIVMDAWRRGLISEVHMVNVRRNVVDRIDRGTCIPDLLTGIVEGADDFTHVCDTTFNETGSPSVTLRQWRRTR